MGEGLDVTTELFTIHPHSIEIQRVTFLACCFILVILPQREVKSKVRNKKQPCTYKNTAFNNWHLRNNTLTFDPLSRKLGYNKRPEVCFVEEKNRYDYNVSSDIGTASVARCIINFFLFVWSLIYEN